MLLRDLAIGAFLRLPESWQMKVRHVRYASGRRLVRLKRRWRHVFPEVVRNIVWRTDTEWVDPHEVFVQGPEVGERVRRYASGAEVYWVDPAKIVYVTAARAFDIHDHKGRVVGGDWDKLTLRFEDLEIYRSYQERLLTGKPWDQLPYYEKALESIERRIPVWGCRNREDLDRRCRGLDDLLDEIKRSGYKSQAALQKEKRILTDTEDEIAVNIGRHGDLLFSNGRHRLACAKIAGVTKVPVKITVRHTEWEEFKRQICSYAERNHGKVYAPLTHIDLQAIPSDYSNDRFELIKDSLGEGNNTLLDIGAHWGYFCHRFEDRGYHCFAVEYDGEHLYFMRKLRRAENREFAILPESILDMGEKGPLKYDVVLALAIFHHFLKAERSFQKLKTLLANLDANEMFFEPHLHSDPQMAGAFVNFTPELFVQFILDHSRFDKFKVVGQCENGRPLYKLWR
jgi:hypothetical protein